MPLQAGWAELIGLDYLDHFAGSPSTIATLLALALIAVVAAAAARRRRLLVLATGLALAAVGGLTLAPAAGWTTFTLTPDPVSAVITALSPQRADLWAWTTADGPANVTLFVPVGLTLGLLLRRAGAAAVLGMLLSMAIESYQAATGTRVGSFADVVSNGLGTVLGATAAAGMMAAAALYRRAVGASRPVEQGKQLSTRAQRRALVSDEPSGFSTN